MQNYSSSEASRALAGISETSSELRSIASKAMQLADRLDAIETTLGIESNVLAVKIQNAPPGLARLLRELDKRGGLAGYTDLQDALNVSGAALGQMRTRTPLGKETVIEIRHADGTFWFQLTKEAKEALALIRSA
ncbi:hypothetical protein [Frigoribacterium sp. VKM Ac-2530]|uniref:hypothetical protein n=1 Tax=Frigoribacterium sp. VKM Ac-2530 TaxID=2783822 RepID=UPI00188A2FB4|nr:hypothetical protein [Frigoribacterium sp. VKM Ac-2530]MBF4580783.1 hypothetical protein [Frigoribacterium sp. VKM Ac-2530]